MAKRIYPVIRQTNEEVFVLAESEEEAGTIARQLPDTAWADRVDRDFIVNDEMSAEDTLEIMENPGTPYYVNPGTRL